MRTPTLFANESNVCFIHFDVQCRHVRGEANNSVLLCRKSAEKSQLPLHAHNFYKNSLN